MKHVLCESANRRREAPDTAAKTGLSAVPSAEKFDLQTRTTAVVAGAFERQVTTILDK